MAVVIAEGFVAWPAGINFARPKSRILTWPRSVTKMFAGLMSRWMIPLLWAAQSASAISVAHSITSSSGSGLPRDVMLKRRAFHKLHGNKRLAVLRVDLVDRADVGMIQRGRRTRLSAKSFESLRILGHVVRKKLERDKPAERGVLGLE